MTSWKPSSERFFIDTRSDVICCLYLSAENKKVLHEAEVEKMFIHLFNHEDVKVQAAAVEALGVMAEFGLSRDSISGWGKHSIHSICNLCLLMLVCCYG